MNGKTMTMRAIGAACAAICICAGGAGSAMAATPATITVTGDGIVTGTPDELQLSLAVSTQAATVSAALDSANEAMNAVRSALTRDGVAQSDLQTSGMSVYPQYNQQNTITGYNVSEWLNAELRDLAKAGKTITDAVQAGGNAVRVNGLSLDLTDQSAALTAKARGAAIIDARKRAGQYAEAAGLRIGRVLSISETGAFAQPSPLLRNAAFGGAASAVPISPGTQQVTTSVVVVYRLKG